MKWVDFISFWVAERHMTYSSMAHTEYVSRQKEKQGQNVTYHNTTDYKWTSVGFRYFLNAYELHRPMRRNCSVDWPCSKPRVVRPMRKLCEVNRVESKPMNATHWFRTLVKLCLEIGWLSVVQKSGPGCEPLCARYAVRDLTGQNSWCWVCTVIFGVYPGLLCLKEVNATVNVLFMKETSWYLSQCWAWPGFVISPTRQHAWKANRPVANQIGQNLSS